MKVIKIDENVVFDEVLAVLKVGGLVMHPTETCYGFAVDIFNEKALEKLYRVKGMMKDKPLSVLISDIEMAREYAEFSDLAEKYASKYWPGPLSLVLSRSEKLPQFFNMGHDFVSMRVSGMDFCRKMVADLNSPISTTSVNRAGELPLYSVDMDVLSEFEGIDLIVDGGVLSENKPSTLLKIVSNDLEVLREGACDLDLSE